MIRVMLVDDQNLVRKGVRSLLELSDEIEVVAEAPDGGEAIEMIPDVGPDVVLCWFDVARGEVLQVATQLRAQGVRVEVYPESTKLKKQLAYAASAGVGAGFAMLLGPDELAEGRPTLRDLTTGGQRADTVEALAALIHKGGIAS